MIRKVICPSFWLTKGSQACQGSRVLLGQLPGCVSNGRSRAESGSYDEGLQVKVSGGVWEYRGVSDRASGGSGMGRERVMDGFWISVHGKIWGD